MADAEHRLMRWLRDAHAMEKQAEQMLSSQASRIENYPQLKARTEDHLRQTRRQAERLEGCIERRGGDTSKLKDVAAQIVALGQGVAGMFASDEVIKSSLASYTFEQMEIASYRILIAAAEQLGDLETVRACEQNLAEEQAMALWLDENIEPLTRDYLVREEYELAEAKR